MIPQLHNFQPILAGAIDKSVFVVDASGPAAGKAVAQWLRFADAGKRVAHDIPNQGVDALNHALVNGLPVKVILPCVAGKDKLQSASSPALPPPLDSSAIDSMRRQAFFGLRRR